MGAIASFYAEIGVDTSKLETGLKKTKTGLSGLASNLNSTVQSVTGFNLAQISAAAVIGTVINTMRKSVTEYISYANAVQDAARLTGTTTEEMSRLVQVADDVRLSQEQLKTAMQMASRQGIDVSISGIQKLSEEYLKLNPGTERAQFLLQTFGRSGADMGRLLEMGAAGIGKATAAVKSNLIVTEASAKKAEAARLAMDEWDDTMTGFKNTLAVALLPAVTAVIGGITKLINKGDELKATFDLQKSQIISNTTNWGIYAKQLVQAGLDTGQLTGKQKLMAEALLDGTLQGEAYDQRLRELIVELSGYDQSGWNAMRAQQGLNDMVSDGIGYFGDLGSTIPTTKKAIEDTYDPTWDLSLAFGELNKQQLYNIASAGLSRDAQLELARHMGILNESSLEQINITDQLREALDKKIISEETYNDVMGRLSDTIDEMHDKNITVTVDNVIATRFTYSGQAPANWQSGRWGGEDWGEGVIPGYANGGYPRVGVPSLVGERGPELFIPGMAGQVVSNEDILDALRSLGGRSDRGGGNTYQMYVTANQVKPQDVIYGYRTLQLMQEG